MQHIETIELGSSQSSITFSSIPQDYDDLIVFVSARSDLSASDDYINLFLNGATGNYSAVLLEGDGSASSSFATTTEHIGQLPGANATSNTFSNISAYVSNYTSTSSKSISIDSVWENNSTDAKQFIVAALNSAGVTVTSIKLEPQNSNFTSDSTFSLYGVTAGGDGTVTTA